MALPLIYSKRFNKKQDRLISYLIREWGIKVAKDYSLKLYTKLMQLTQQPNLGKPSEKRKDIRSIHVTNITGFTTA